MLTTTKEIAQMLADFQAYAAARQRFLRILQTSTSCRDPLAEFSEQFVAQLLGGSLATSRVQKGYDLVRQSSGRKVQVKYLCNASEKWINEHHIRFPEGVSEYALVVFEGLQLQAVLVFPRETLGQVNLLLRKRHGHQETELQFTHRNFLKLCAERDKFEALGVEIYCFA